MCLSVLAVVVSAAGMGPLHMTLLLVPRQLQTGWGVMQVSQWLSTAGTVTAGAATTSSSCTSTRIRMSTRQHTAGMTAVL
jgi:hypothetical protein